jgi:hypothetical protein
MHVDVRDRLVEQLARSAASLDAARLQILRTAPPYLIAERTGWRALSLKADVPAPIVTDSGRLNEEPAETTLVQHVRDAGPR